MYGAPLVSGELRSVKPSFNTPYRLDVVLLCVHAPHVLFELLSSPSLHPFTAKTFIPAALLSHAQKLLAMKIFLLFFRSSYPSYLSVLTLLQIINLFETAV